MNTLTKITIALLATCTLNVSAKVNDTIEKTFNLSGQGQLVLENVNGDVVIESWQNNSVKVTAEINASNQKARERLQVKMKQSGDRISVETDHENNSGSWGNNNNGNSSVDYVVMVPKDIDLRDIDVVNGSLTIKNVSGELNADVVNGSVDASGLASDVNVESVNGAVELSFDDTANDLEISVETVNGSIRLYVSDTFGAKVQASTGNGSIKTDFGLQGTKGTYYGNELEGKFGDASSEIELESVNGSIKILKK
ncbi:DUF4097 domain-containing protein [Colwelliaceae bacterium BS250]